MLQMTEKQKLLPKLVDPHRDRSMHTFSKLGLVSQLTIHKLTAQKFSYIWMEKQKMHPIGYMYVLATINFRC